MVKEACDITWDWDSILFSSNFLIVVFWFRIADNNVIQPKIQTHAIYYEMMSYFFLNNFTKYIPDPLNLYFFA